MLCPSAAVKFRGTSAQTNYSLTNYTAELEMQDKVRGLVMQRSGLTWLDMAPDGQTAAAEQHPVAGPGVHVLVPPHRWRSSQLFLARFMHAITVSAQ